MEGRSIFQRVLIFTSFCIVPIGCLFIFYVFPTFDVHFSEDTPRIAVQAVSNLLDAYQQKILSGKLDLKTAQNEAADLITTLKYNDKEYFWIHNQDLIMVKHPVKPELVGKHLDDLADPQGKKLFVEMNKVVADKGEGWVSYLWPKPGAPSDKPISKMAYVKLYKPWGWVIGSGVYEEDVAQLSRPFKYRIFATVVFYMMITGLWGWLFARSISGRLLALGNQLLLSLNELKELSGELEKVSHETAQEAEKQASALQQTSATSDEIHSMVQKNNDSTLNSLEVVKMSKQSAQVGAQMAQSMKTAVTEIETGNKNILRCVQESNQEISKIVSVISEIGSKTKLIDEIVFQTKLLSFNASVEAARAGENGKGFAVVAEEVGNLAQMSGDAAKDINELLERSLKDVASIIEKTGTQVSGEVDRARFKVDQGMQIATESEAAMVNVNKNIERVSEIAQEISSASHEQVIGLGELNKKIREIDLITQGNLDKASAGTELAKKFVGASKSLIEVVETLHVTVRGRKIT